MGALEDDEVTAVGVYGMGGIGKTTMVKHVSDEARRKGTFRHVIMAGISHSPDLKKIQGILADRLAIQLKDQTETGRGNKLSKAIKRKNKMLIILDDIWEAIDLSIIGIPSYKELQNRNSKILFTTRSLDVCKSMESQPNILLDVLSDQDSWKFFVMITKLSFEIPSPFYNVARDVARGCAGLPIALEAVAKALKEKEMNEWNEAAQRLKVSQPATHDDVRVFNCVKFSYDCLRSEDAKSCFLLCGLFPQEYDIQIEDLLTYGFGKGLFQNCRICNTLKDARDIVHSEVRYLKSSGLLLGGKHDGQIRMHDVIRQMAILISFSEDGQRALVKAGCKLQKWPKINPQAGYYAISLMMNKIPKLPEKFVCPKLQILLLQHNPDVKEIPNSFLESLNELRVLDLSKTSISSLPSKFDFLNNLHTLYLDSCETSFDLSVLGKLKKLEILSLRECCHKVPKEIGDLANLRMLDITESRIRNCTCNVILKTGGVKLRKPEKKLMFTLMSWLDCHI
ncbi:putative P-loop containing nucleoside triphosphate hydrolase, leucine-rich repeat domain, L [Rosa chinensis]|uniref:Putative P-loop containing nucleoside triphosphate hydrolase, leucine-rich repeat domain, L n=1 Tax=Rosa chinensis TaxID=74649 RepID=A0A2P6PDS0_ROSCH|nr:putative P-loop containing nucleoside triphosphate hydrolase, leucine-rich repeat domain, L [Rosa chinensis]